MKSERGGQQEEATMKGARAWGEEREQKGEAAAEEKGSEARERETTSSPEAERDAQARGGGGGRSVEMLARNAKRERRRGRQSAEGAPKPPAGGKQHSPWPREQAVQEAAEREARSGRRRLRHGAVPSSRA